MLRLSLTTDYFGTPNRLVVASDMGSTFLRGLAPHVREVFTFRTRTRDWACAIDPYIFNHLIDRLPNLLVDDVVYDWAAFVGAKQREVHKAVFDEVSIPGFEGRLWGLQHNAVRFLEQVERGILAFGMGTGKTVIASAAVKHLDLPRVLVICIDTVKHNWRVYMDEWADRADTYIVESAWKGKKRRHIITGTKAEREARIKDIFEKKAQGILILNYNQAKIHMDLLKEMGFDCVICDEAHKVSNRKHKTKKKDATISKSVFEICKRVPYVWLLTGTAIKNKHEDLFHLLKICDPNRFSAFGTFLSLYMHTVMEYNGQLVVVGIKEEEYFNGMLGTYMLVRTTEEVLPDLPEKQYVDMYIPMTPRQQGIYDDMMREFRVAVYNDVLEGQGTISIKRATTTIGKIMRLRQISLSPALVDNKHVESGKLLALAELLPELYENGEKVVVFSWFKSFLDYIGALLDNLGIPYAMIHGDISSQERQRVEQQLNEGQVSVVLGTLRSMSEGLNLQVASTAIFCDSDYVPAVNQQAEARIHRAGITESRTIIRLLHKDSVDEAVLDIVKLKETIVDETIGQVELVRRMIERSGSSEHKTVGKLRQDVTRR